MVSDVREPQRLRIPDQLAEDAAAMWQLADRRAQLVVDAHCDEAFELTPLDIEDPESRVPGAGQLARDLHQPIQNRLQLEVGNEPPPHLHQAAKPLGLKHPRSHLRRYYGLANG